MDVVFLGINDVGFRIYEWLCRRDGVEVTALLTRSEQLDLIRREHPDLVLSVGFDHLVPPEIIEVPPRGAINLHPSFLPYNRGKSPNVWPLIEGTPAGVTIHYMDAEYDTGDVIARREVETDFSDTGKTLHARLEDAQFELFTDVWPELADGTVEATPQDADAGTTHTTADFVERCELDPDETVRVKALLDRLRALTFPPFDNAYVELAGERYYVDVEIRPAAETTDEDGEGLLSSY